MVQKEVISNFGGSHYQRRAAVQHRFFYGLLLNSGFEDLRFAYQLKMGTQAT